MRVLFQGLNGLHHYYVVLPAYIEMLNQGIRVDVFAPSLPEIPRLLNFGVKRFKRNVSRMVLMFLTSLSLSRFSAPMRSAAAYLPKGLGYRLIHLNDPFIESTKTIISKFSNTPKILTFHDSNMVNYPNERIIKVASVIQKVKIVATPSGWLRKILYEKTGSNSLVIPHCVDLILFNPLLRKKVARKSLEIDMAKKVVMWNGRLDPDKDPQTMLNVINVLKKFQDISFILKYRVNYYKPDYTKKVLKSLRKLEKSLGNRLKVICCDIPLYKMPYLYRAADVYVTTSPLESFSLATVEAMACGLPVVVPKSSALPEVVGDAGLYCEVGDAECFAKDILRILDDEKLAKSLTFKGLDRVMRSFSPMKVTKLYSNLYGSIVCRGI